MRDGIYMPNHESPLFKLTREPFDPRYSEEVNLLYHPPGKRPYVQTSIRFMPTITGMICQRWNSLQNPGAIPPSYEYVSHTAS